MSGTSRITRTLLAFALVVGTLGVGGTAAAAKVQIMDLLPGGKSSRPQEFAVAGGMLFFVAGDDGSSFDAWVSEGGPRKTRRISKWRMRDPIGFDDIVIFAGQPPGIEPYRTDGTPAGTALIADLAPGRVESGDRIFFRSSSPQDFVRFKDRVYFRALGGLWKTDGTEAGTTEVTAICGEGLVKFENHLYFGCEQQLWKSDGTAGGTKLLKDAGAGPAAAGRIRGLTPVGDQLFFSGPSASGRRSLWVSDGTNVGTRAVGPLGTPDGWNNPRQLTAFQGKVFFTARAPSGKYGIWKSDGTDRGTKKLKGGFSRSLEELTKMGGRLFFVGSRHDLRKLSSVWKTDGTARGTSILKAIKGAKGQSVRDLEPLNGKLYFVAGRFPLSAVWETRGNAKTTRRVKAIQDPPQVPLSPQGLTAANDSLYFSGYGRGGVGRELYRYKP